MSQDPEDEDGPAKTVFEPSPRPAGGDKSAAEDAWFSGEVTPPVEADVPSDGDEPAAAPRGRRGRKAAPPPSTILQPSAPPPAATPPPMATGAPFSAPGATPAGRVSIGSVLNHIFEVRRFIARGGMGEVYEGVNVNTDEKVAIKVILPHLAADPNVQAMFRKEARTLTRLSHPALVQYRVLANEPELGVLYIVTDFVDGVGLDQLIGKITVTPADLLALTQRLANGLRVAHDLGAIHRDISPDNILLPGEKISTATIIDFGIAKDLDASHATIVGDGFAGKLAFVAPEQFGDFGREIGPWTDIYSLGLVMLAVFNGKPIDMGSTLVEAVDRRRAGPDLSILPAPLQPLFGKMLAPNPKDRFRSMEEVTQAITAVDLNAPAGRKTAPPPPRKVADKAPPPPRAPKPAPVDRGERRLPLPMPAMVAIAVGGAVLLIGLPLALMLGRGDDAGGDVETTAAATVDQKLQSISCSWLEPDGGPDSTRLKGAASSGFEGPTSQRVQGADTSGVMFIQGQSCSLLEAVRPLKAATVPGAEWVKAASPSFTPARQAECGDDPRVALAYVDVDTATASGEDMALYLMRPGGTVQAVFRSKAQIRAGSGLITSASPSGTNRTRIGLCNDLQGPYGLLALRGAGPFTADTGGGGPIANRLAEDAKDKGWTSQMDWYRVEPAPAAAAAPPPAPLRPAVAAPAPAPKPKAAPPKVVAPRPKPKVERAAPAPAPKPAPSRPACDPALGCD